jgi:hypothetical protein
LPAHLEFLTEFDAALRGGPVPPGLIARDMDEVERCFSVYRNNVSVSLTEALATRFPVVRRLVGEAFFAPLARLYAEEDRPRGPVLAEWGEGFAGFLAAFPPSVGYPYLPDVARIEFARGRAFHAPDAEPVDPAALAAADPDRVRLVLNPSVQLLRLATAALAIWARSQPGGEGQPPLTGPETALILRDASFDVPVRALRAGDSALVEAMLAGSTLADAANAAQEAEPGHDPSHMLVALMRAGAITEARE